MIHFEIKTSTKRECNLRNFAYIEVVRSYKPCNSASQTWSADTLRALESMVMFCSLFGSKTCLLGEGVLLFDSSLFIEF